MDRGDQDDDGRWPRDGLPGGLTLASYLTAAPQASAQYRLIVDTLLDEQARSVAGVSRADLEVLLRDRLRGQLGDQQGDQAGPLLAALPLDGRLDQLVRWGVADQWPDPTTGATAEIGRAHV